jgi:hypothetical protein
MKLFSINPCYLLNLTSKQTKKVSINKEKFYAKENKLFFYKIYKHTKIPKVVDSNLFAENTKPLYNLYRDKPKKLIIKNVM